MNTTKVWYLQYMLDMPRDLSMWAPVVTVTDHVVRKKQLAENVSVMNRVNRFSNWFKSTAVETAIYIYIYTDKFNWLNIQRVTWTCTCFSIALRKFGGTNAEQSHLPSYRLLAAVRKAFRHSTSESLIRESCEQSCPCNGWTLSVFNGPDEIMAT